MTDPANKAMNLRGPPFAASLLPGLTEIA